MTKITILESGMHFGPFDENRCFQIEKSQSYLTMQEGVKIAEFLLLRKQKKGETLWIIEAKSSSPNPATKPDFDCFIEDLRDKFSNTMYLYLAGLLERRPAVASELSMEMKVLSPKKVDFRFILVIAGHQIGWLAPLKYALSNALRPLIKIWKLSPNAVIVLNDDLAREQQLIL